MRKYIIIIDTNVLLTANGSASQADESCQLSCIEKLTEIQASGRVFVDSGGLIFNEYSRHLSHRGQPGLGDAFFKWLWDNQGYEEICTIVPLSALDPAGLDFEIFPKDNRLVHFDPSDRKFVATALASPENPPILNATDSDWLHFQNILHASGVFVEFLCPHILKDIQDP